MNALWFALAAAGGTLVRWRAWATTRFRPLATFAVNITGAFSLGLLADASSKSQLVGGVAGLGAMTTFSTFVAELIELHASDRRLAWAYGAATLVVGVGAAWLGLRLS